MSSPTGPPEYNPIAPTTTPASAEPEPEWGPPAPGGDNSSASGSRKTPDMPTPRTLLIGIGALLAIGAAWFILSARGESGREEFAVLVSDRGDVHVVAEGEEPSRENRSAANYATARVQTAERHRQLGPVVDGMHIFLSESSDQDILYGWRPGETPRELLASSGRLIVTVVEDQLFVRDRREETSRCYSGRPNELEDNRRFRGASCSFTAEGYLITNDKLRDSYVVEVFDRKSKLIFSEELDGEGTLVNDGSLIWINGEASVEVIRRQTNTVILERDRLSVDNGGSTFHDHTIALITVSESGDLELDIVDDVGVETLDLGEGRATATFADNGDLYVLETDLAGATSVSLWNAETRALDLLQDGTDATPIAATRQGLLIRSSQDDGEVIELISPGGDTELAEVSASGNVLLLENDEVAIIDRVGDTESLTFLSLDGKSRQSLRSWDRVNVLAHRPGTLLAAVIEGEDVVPVLLDLTSESHVELGVFDSISSGALVGDTALVTTVGRRTETIPYRVQDGEAIDDYDYDDYEVETRTSAAQTRRATVSTPTFRQAEPCINQGLRRFFADEQIEVESEESVCLFAEGEITISASLTDDVRPRLEVDAGGIVQVDVARSDSARVDIQAEGVAVITASNLEGSAPIIIVAQSS